MENKTTYIYAIIDPRNGNIRYIGKADNCKARWNRHILDARKNNKKNRKNNFINFLLNKNINPIFEIIDEIPFSEWQFWERHYISLFKTWGFDLFNCTLGGDGGTMPPEILKIIIEKNKKHPPSNKGKRHTEATKQLIRVANLGKKQSQDTIKKRSESMKGKNRGPRKPMSEETKKRLREMWAEKNKDRIRITRKRIRKISKEYIIRSIRASIKKYYKLQYKDSRHTEETKIRISNSLKGRIKTPEEIEKTRQKNIGQKRTPEAKEKMRQAKLGKPNKNLKHDEKWLEAMRNGCKKRRGVKRSLKEIIISSESHMGKKRRIYKKIEKDPNGPPKTLTEAHKEKLRLAWIKRKEMADNGIGYSNELKEKIRLEEREEVKRIAQERLTMIF